MAELKYSELLARNRALGSTLTGNPYRIALLSNIVMTQLVDVMEYSLRADGLRAEVTLGDYDTIVQDSERLNALDATVVFWEAGNLLDGLHAKADTMSPSALSALADRVEAELSLLLNNLKHVPLVLMNRFSSLIFSANDLRPGALAALSHRLNRYLEKHAPDAVILVNLDDVLAKVGLEAAIDWRQLQSAKAPYSIHFLKSYADHVAPAFRAATGRGRKVLVLDCDNTLWGGVLGEDGETRIEISDLTPRGRVFREVQCLLQGLKQKGVLLALCSKNNPEDVDALLSSHPDMLLRDADFAAKRVNWCDKATNIVQLAEELNLGLDSLAFLDDSAFELDLVAKACPQVRCFKVPDTLSEYPPLIRRLSQDFFSLSVTSEDAEKTERYRQEQLRRHDTSRFTSTEDFLRSLGLTVQLDWGLAVPVARAAQLSQKTNQFNLTTRRYTETDLRRMLSDGTHFVATFAVSDRFGDYGVVGLLILRKEPDAAVASIDTLLMSCRVLGRNVERAFLCYLMTKLPARGIAKLRAEYIRTARNDQVSQFYDSLGFHLLESDKDRRSYELALSDFAASRIDYIEVIDHDQ